MQADSGCIAPAEAELTRTVKGLRDAAVVDTISANANHSKHSGTTNLRSP